jgi:hypothetical protein
MTSPELEAILVRPNALWRSSVAVAIERYTRQVITEPLVEQLNYYYTVYILKIHLH